jgi:hypothetical protein
MDCTNKYKKRAAGNTPAAPYNSDDNAYWQTGAPSGDAAEAGAVGVTAPM